MNYLDDKPSEKEIDFPFWIKKKKNKLQWHGGRYGNGKCNANIIGGDDTIEWFRCASALDELFCRKKIYATPKEEERSR